VTGVKPYKIGVTARDPTPARAPQRRLENFVGVGSVVLMVACASTHVFVSAISGIFLYFFCTAVSAKVPFWPVEQIGGSITYMLSTLLISTIPTSSTILII
jgi:hypothetical protein